MIDYQSPEYRRSRAAYTAQCAVEYFISLLVTDAFLAKLLSYLGISDALTGIISSFITLAFVIQIFSILLVRARIGIKGLVLTLDTLSVFFFMALYLIPFLPVGKEMRTALVVISVLVAYAGKYLITSIYFRWANSFVDPMHRGSFSATKEIISLLGGMIFTAAAGYAVDRFEDAGSREGAFLFLAVAILILNIANFVTISLIKKDAPLPKDAKRESLFATVKNIVGNKSFRHVIVMGILWETARYFSVGFMGVYKTKDLMISVFAVQIINIGANIARMAVSRWFGRYSDRRSYARGFELGLWIAAAAFLVNVFTTRSTWFLIILYTVLFNVSTAGTNQNSFNITYSYVDGKYITEAMAIKSCVGGLFGFGASLLAGKILSGVQENGNQLLGIPLYGQQLLSLISFLLVLALILYTRLVIEKQKVIVQ